jgi:hypothetical protein
MTESSASMVLLLLLLLEKIEVNLFGRKILNATFSVTDNIRDILVKDKGLRNKKQANNRLIIVTILQY